MYFGAKVTQMPTIYLLFGSNLGNRVEFIRHGIQLLVQENIHLLQMSHIYETEAWGIENQANFYNLCVKAECRYSPLDLLHKLKNIERMVGRQQRQRWGERELDIDILYYGKQLYNSEELKLPHAQLIKRNFALAPLAELAPKKKHPKLKLTTTELLHLCTDQKKAFRMNFKPKV